MKWWWAQAQNPCPGCGAELEGFRCNRCSATVLPDRSRIAGSTFHGNVYFQGSGHVDNSIFDFQNVKRADIHCHGNLHVSSSQFECHVPVTVAGGQSAVPLWTKSEVEESASELGLTFGTEALVAWRVWRLCNFRTRYGEEPRLLPLSARTAWVPRQKASAVCIASGEHEAPWLGCTCGVWAMRDEEMLKQHASGPVYGEVYLWGRVLEFEDGYRAQYAYPKALQVERREVGDEVAQILSALYGVPVGLT